LKQIEKRINGQDGRKEPTGTSLYKSWNALEEEISNVGQNARTYNEDGSAIYVLAGQLEVCNLEGKGTRSVQI